MFRHNGELTDFLPWQWARDARLTGQKVRSNDWFAPQSGAGQSGGLTQSGNSSVRTAKRCERSAQREPVLLAIRCSRFVGHFYFPRYQPVGWCGSSGVRKRPISSDPENKSIRFIEGPDVRIIVRVTSNVKCGSQTKCELRGTCCCIDSECLQLLAIEMCHCPLFLPKR